MGEGREEKGGSLSSAGAHSESQPLTVIKNSPRGHCEVPLPGLRAPLLTGVEEGVSPPPSTEDYGKRGQWERMQRAFCGTSCGNEAVQGSRVAGSS